MKRLLLLLLFQYSLYSFAQKALPVTGVVIDTGAKSPLQFASVLLLKQKSNRLVQFGRTDAAGKFSLSAPDTGAYTILITFPKFADLREDVTVLEIGYQAGNLALTPTAKLLEEVIVRGQGAIRIKGDTTEFNADSFVVKQGATVEDLLKKLPGFQVNSKGEITAQGKRVEKVLVDGEEFFGDDPTMATKNLNAKQVEKVQLFDSKNEQQQLKGITTGAEGKTLNIKLKDEAKKGAFGKVNAGTDFNKFYDAKGLGNIFQGKRKISGYATKSNVNTGSLDWGDREKVGIEDDYEFDEISGYYMFNGDADEFDNWSVRGLPKSASAGALYNNKWKDGKQGVNLSYRYNSLGTTNQSSTLTQNILPNSLSFRNVYSTTEGLNQQHAGNGKWEWKIDSLATLKFVVAGKRKWSDLLSNTNSEFLDGERNLVNKSVQSREASNENLKADNVLTYKQLFKKKTRQLISTLRTSWLQDDNLAMNNTRIDFYRNGLPSATTNINQMRVFNGQSRSFGTKHTFNEPLTTKLNLVLEYAYNQMRATSFRNTFNENGTGKYEFLDTAFSNNFKLLAASHTGSATLRLVDKKIKWAAGGGLTSTVLNLNNLDKGIKNEYRFLNFTPQANFGYTPKPQTNFVIGYRGNTIQPNIQQLQPVRNNDDPLREVRGNPELRVGFNHSLTVNYNKHKVLGNRGIWLSGRYNNYDKAITNYNLLDTATGKQVYYPVNVNGNYNWNFWSSFFRGGKSPHVRYSANLSANGGQNTNFVNGLRNVTNFASISAGPRISYDKENKFSISVGPNLGYNVTKTSLNPGINNNFFSLDGYADLTVNVSKKLEFNTSFEANNRQALSAFGNVGNVHINIWNATISQKISKKNSSRLLLVANDILNQNKGFSRMVNSNFVVEDRYQRISRYFLLQFEWNFTKNNGDK